MRGRGLLLALGALVVVGGCAADAPTRAERHGQTESVTFAADVAGDGTIAVHTVVHFAGDGGVVGLRAPLLATVDSVTVNGGLRSDTANGYTAQLGVPFPDGDVTFRVVGAVERYEDIAVVTIPVWARPGDARRTDPRVRVRGDVRLPAAPVADAHWHDATPRRTTTDDAVVHLDGEVAMWHDSDLVVAVPADAFPALAVLPGGPRLEYFTSRQAHDDRVDEQFASVLDNDDRRADRFAALYWLAVAVEIAVPVLVVVWRVARRGATWVRATRDVPDRVSDPPGREAPAVVALLHNDGHDIGGEAVAATVLDLADRKVIGLDGITSDRYVLHVGEPARGLTPGEGALLGRLRADATDGDITGPPLAVARGGQWWATFRRDTLRQATTAGLVRRRYPSGLFITSVVLLTLTTLPLWARSPEAAVAGLVVGSVFVMLPFVGGYVLSPNGMTARARWDAFGRHARESSEIADAGPPAIVVWGPHLTYGAALGGAPHAVDALGGR